MKFAKFAVLFLVAWSLLATGTTKASAQDGDSQWSDPWRFHVNLYGWLPDAPATINVKGREVVDVPEDLDTILDSLNAAAMFELEAHKGPLVLFANVVYYDGEYDDGFTGPVSGASRRFELEEEVWAIKYGVGYRLGSWKLGESPGSPTLALYPWVGAFYFHDDWKVKVDPVGVVLDGVKVDGTFEFNTPMVGLTQRVNFSERWYLNLSFSYGGWEVDDVEEIYDFIGNVGYRFTMWDVPSKVFAGYRYLHIDWEDQPEELKLTAKGPFFGIGWEF